MWFLFSVIQAQQLLSVNTVTPVFGVPVNLTATLSPSNCTGSVDFWQGYYVPDTDEFEMSSYIATANVVSGTAAYTWSESFGNIAVIALYSGDTLNAGSSSSFINITSYGTSYVLLNATSLGPSSVQLNAYLTPSVATGSVQFYNTRSDLSTPFILGSSPVIDGVATFNWTTAAPGINQYQALYTGSYLYLNFTSVPVNFTTV